MTEIATVEDRDNLPPGTVALWTHEDHPDFLPDWWPDEPREFAPYTVVLHHDGDGWVHINDVSTLLADGMLPPLPWRLLWAPTPSATEGGR